jgi:phosphoribosylamine--glycine ligase
VIEYNCRFGDPETQVVLPMLDGDLCDIFEAVCDHKLKYANIKWKTGSCTCVVMASGGYPLSYPKGLEISGLDENGQVEGAFVYHAGTKLSGDGKFLTNGGRVLGVTCTALTLEEALRRSYAAVDKIGWDKAHFRRDIGQRALKAQTDPLALDYKDDMEDYIESNGVYLRQ